MIGFSELNDMITENKSKDMVESGPKEKGAKDQIRMYLEKAAKVCKECDMENPMEYMEQMLEEILGPEKEEPGESESEGEDMESEDGGESKGKRGALIVALLKKKKGE